MGPLLFNVYINDFSCIINKGFHIILFANVTNILVSPSDLNEINSILNSGLRCIFECFQHNHLVLKLNETYLEKLTSSKLLTYPLHVAYNNWAVAVTWNIKFLGIHLDCNPTWKSHKDFSNKINLLLHVEKIITICNR